ncbi:MAG: GGDEF domain-containing protein, partial [Spirochaetota bacterium]
MNVVTPPNFSGNSKIPNDSDSFNLFYQSVLAAGSLTDFETNLFSFMYEILQQRTCLFYNNANQDEGNGGKGNFVLQRGSYSNQFAGTTLRKTFPTNIQLDIAETPEILQLKHWYEQQADGALMANFFSIASNQSRYPFTVKFKEFSNCIRCGMQLSRGPREIFGILLYERPLNHPYLNSPLRLQQFQMFLSLALAHRQTVNYATLDQLTGMHRKFYFLNLVEQLLYGNRAVKEHQLLVIDIDFFKKFNDTYGHLEGDNCLRAIAKAIKKALRTRDFTGRFGGEEFMCLIQSELDQVEIVAQRIHKTIQKIQLQSSDGKNIPVPTVSIGIATFRPGETTNQLIERA